MGQPRKLDWYPPAEKLTEIFEAISVGLWHQAVYFSKELSPLGVSRFKAKVTMAEKGKGDFRVTIGRINYAERKFLVREKKQGRLHSSCVVVTDKKSL